jgi:Mg/Co/Ni transporter MgtE
LCSFHPLSLSLSLSLSRYIEMIADLEDSSSALGGGDLLLSSSQPGSPTTTTGSNNNNTGDYRKESVLKILKARIGWLSAFFLGLILAAVVVERFEELLTHEVELSYFVPLLIGHGGNTGSQSVATVIRAIALKQIKPESGREVAQVLFKEAISGFVMGGFLGALVFVLSLVWEGISPLIGLVVAISLPLVSVWANVLGAGLPLFAVRMGFNPAVTSAPLMTTIVDSSGLVIYFLVAQRLMPETLGDVAVKIAAEAVGAGSDGSAT